jgi:hypothetical protein
MKQLPDQGASEGRESPERVRRQSTELGVSAKKNTLTELLQALNRYEDFDLSRWRLRWVKGFLNRLKVNFLT